MAESVVSYVVQGLGDVLIQEAKFLRGVSGQAEVMQIELEIVQGYLEDADKKQDADKRVHAWVSKIREVAYDAEDAIGSLVDIAFRRRRRTGILSTFKRYACIINEASELHRVGSEIETIKTRISALTRCLETYGIKHVREGGGSSSAHERRQRLSRQPYSNVVEEYTVGLDGDVKTLVAQLVNEEMDACRVVSIWGIGGLGKTTLAKKVYRHSKIRRHFERFAWACVSQQCQRRDVWEGLLFDLLSPSKEKRQKIKGLGGEELADMLYQIQFERKCLVVIDNIWTIDAWESLRVAFPNGRRGSKILLTTRREQLALHVDPGGYLHQPRLLTVMESFKLLKRKAFPEQPYYPGFKHVEMEELGRKMVARCEGLPLAIVVLGGVLATKHSLNKWKKVYKNIRRAIGLSEVLALSYHELSYPLRSCFLHLAFFPEGYNIPIKKLFRMWVAEGIVSSMQNRDAGGETLEDVAECYLDELMHKCMVEVGVRGPTGRIKTCRLHTLMRDLCLLKAKQENFLEFVTFQDGNEQIVSNESSWRRVHRLGLCLSEETQRNFYLEREITSRLRSLLVFGTKDTIISQKMKSKFKDIKLLKVLDLESCHFPRKLPRAIGNLIHLRYLSLFFPHSTNLPSSIGNLKCLETLILQSGYGRIRVPNVIWKMEWLRHLYLPKWIGKRSGKLRLGNLSNLQTLQHFDAMRFDVKELIKLANLKKLEIKNLQSVKPLEGILISPSVTFFNSTPRNVTLDRICSLQISINSSIIALTETDLLGLFSGRYGLDKLFLDGWIEKLPEYSLFPSSLSKLTLQNSGLTEDPMATLEKLRNLTILRLHEDAFVGKKMVCSSKGFPQLKSLLLSNLRNLEEWSVSDEAMPTLCILEFFKCSELKMIPNGLKFITTLQQLKIFKMPEAFERRVQKGEDSDKVQHVPSIIFKDFPI